MKKLILIEFICVITTVVFGQNNMQKIMSLELKFGPNFPLQDDYLRENWDGSIFSELNIYKNVLFFDLKGGFSYEYIGSIGDDKIRFLTPNLGIQKDFKFSRFYFTPGIEIGYTFFNYSIGEGVNLGAGNIAPREESDKGFNTGFDLKLHFGISDRFLIGIGNKYNIIYKEFDKDVNPNNNSIIGLYKGYISFLYIL
jgi:hypothetical protein